jgi:hypothetical protein
MTPSASPDEAAAIVAAVERFIAETAPVRPADAVSPWTRAALLEGVGAKLMTQESEGWY